MSAFCIDWHSSQGVLAVCCTWLPLPPVPALSQSQVTFARSHTCAGHCCTASQCTASCLLPGLRRRPQQPQTLGSLCLSTHLCLAARLSEQPEHSSPHILPFIAILSLLCLASPTRSEHNCNARTASKHHLPLEALNRFIGC